MIDTVMDAVMDHPDWTRHWLPESSTGGYWLIKMGAIAIDEILVNRPGAIVRSAGSESMRYVPPPMVDDSYGFIAGMISEDV